jgi:hypothetical protein
MLDPAAFLSDPAIDAAFGNAENVRRFGDVAIGEAQRLADGDAARFAHGVHAPLVIVGKQRALRLLHGDFVAHNLLRQDAPDHRVLTVMPVGGLTGGNVLCAAQPPRKRMKASRNFIACCC